MGENYKDKIIQLVKEVNEEKFLRYLYILLTEMIAKNQMNITSKE